MLKFKYNCSSLVPGAPPRKLEVEALNSTAIRVTWKPPLSGKQHGQIRGYQVIYSRLENGEPRGHPNIMDVALPEAQVLPANSLLLCLTVCTVCWKLLLLLSWALFQTLVSFPIGCCHT